MEYQISKKAKSCLSEFGKAIIPLARNEKDELDLSDYIECMSHNTPGNSTSGK